MIRIEQEIIDQPDVERLFKAADAGAAQLYPGQDRAGPTAASLIAVATRFFVARIDGAAAGCAGFAPGDAGWAELKRVFVDPAARGQSIGRDLVLAAEALAANERFAAMRLETGARATSAIRLYRRLGYVDRAPFGPYVDDPHSLFMAKHLGLGPQTR